MVAELQDLVLQSLQILFQFTFEVVIIQISLHIIFKFRALESSLFQHLYVVDNVGFHASNYPKLIAIWIFLPQVLVASWDSTRLVAKLVVLFSLELQFLCNKSLKLILVFNGVIFLSDQFLGTSFPVCLVILVMLSQDCVV